MSFYQRAISTLLALSCLVCCFATTTLAQSLPEVVRIEVEGNYRVETEAILRQIETAVGEVPTDRQLGDDIRAIYELGFFQDISIDADIADDGIVLTYIVAEMPAVASIAFEGNDQVDGSELVEEVDLRIGGILDESDVRENATKLEDLYREKGYYLAEVSYRIEPMEDGQVRIVFEIQEYARIRIARVSFVGNEALTDEQITGVMRTRPGDHLSFLTQFGNFDPEFFAADLQNIRVYYYDSGYLDVTVADPTVELSRDGTRMYITIPIEEGEPYDVASVDVTGDTLFTHEELMGDTTLAVGERFRSSVIRTDMEALTERYRNIGYAYANVNMLHSIDTESRQIDIQYDIDRGELVYIGRIDVVGNTLTRDRVIRRELDIVEGELYSRRQIDRSRAYVRRLGFFEDVTIREQANASNPTLLDLQIEVTERPTRSFQIGMGFSSVESFVATAQVSENNLFGRGQNLSLNISYSGIRQLFVLSFVEPRLLDSPWQLSLNLFNRQVLFTEFERQSRGVDVSVGYRIIRPLTLTLGYEIEDVNITPGGTSGNNDVRLSLYDGGLTSSLTSGLYLDTRNDRTFPSRGMYHSVSMELADDLWFSENEFFRVRTGSRFYFEPIWSDWIIKFNIELGYVGSTNPDQQVPIYERFYVGGPNSVRGFPRLSLSPGTPTASGSSPDSGTRVFPLGGNRELVFNAELEFPLLTAVGIRGVVFFDAGNAFAIGENMTLRTDIFADSNGEDYGNRLRTSVGMGFRWRSPIGPLRFEWGFPLSRLLDERPMVFEFSIGDPF